MVYRRLGTTGLSVSRLGFGTFKIGRNQSTKYAESYAIPFDDEVQHLLSRAVDLGIRYFDTAPSYGVSEERLGLWLAQRGDLVISTKAGEQFVDGRSHYDFSPTAIHASIEQSRQRLKREVLDLVFIHSDGGAIEHDHAAAAEALQTARARQTVRAIGFSGKTVEGARLAMAWADVLMVEYHLEDRLHETLIAEAADRGIGIVVKKGLASGRLGPSEALRFVLANPGVDSVVVSTRTPGHLDDLVAAIS